MLNAPVGINGLNIPTILYIYYIDIHRHIKYKDNIQTKNFMVRKSYEINNPKINYTNYLSPDLQTALINNVNMFRNFC